MLNAVADYVGTRRYLDPELTGDLESLVSGLVQQLLSGELKSGVIGLQLAGSLDKEGSPEITMTVTDTRKRQRRYALAEAYQMRLFEPGEM